MTEYGLGRLPAPDPDDHKFLIANRLAAPLTSAPTRTYRYWNQSGWWGNQGALPQCVGYAWAHWLEDGPVTHSGPAPIVPPDEIYHGAQLIDEWPGEDYDGTSVRAGAKVLQARGLIGEYNWAFDEQTIQDTILTIGPVVMGTVWYEGFFEPDNNGIIHPTGPVVGGHAWVLNGYNRKNKMYRAKQSWIRSWGKHGNFYLPDSLVARLVAEDGEACIAQENKTGILQA